MIRVLIAEDSPLVARLLQSHLENDRDIKVVGLAKNGTEAIQMVKHLKPNLITMDIHMPGMDGVEATKQIMAYDPTPILILTSSVSKGKQTGEVFKALEYGALEVMEKKAFESTEVEASDKARLVEKVKWLSRVRVITHILGKIEKRHHVNIPALQKGENLDEQRAIGMVASTGGPQALLDVLKELPASLPMPVFLVQHISPGFVESFADWLGEQISLKTKVAEQGESAQPGWVYIAPHNYHMKISSRGRILLSQEEPVCRERPSGTILLASLAESYGSQALGIVFTGMGRDGAEGLQRMHEARSHTIAQDEATSVIYGMPKAAIELGAAEEILALEDISKQILKWAGGS